MKQILLATFNLIYIAGFLALMIITINAIAQ